MNYYEHHLGDYVKDTLYLTMLQDGAYRRLIDVYYIKEEPIPLDMKDAYQRARATTKPERDAVAMVLKEFFTKTPDGWRHGRCDEEIERYRQKQEAVPAKKENDRERQQRARDRRKALFTELRDFGVTAPWDATTSQLEIALQQAKSQHDSQGNNGQVTPPVTPPVTRDNTATQSPVPSNHIKEESTSAAASTPPPKWHEEDPPAALPGHGSDPVHIRALELVILLRQRGAALQADPHVQRWAATGVTDVQVLQALETAQKRRESAKSVAPIGSGYLDAILTDITAPQQTNVPTGNDPYREKLRREQEVADEVWGRTPQRRKEIDMGVIDATDN